MPESYSPQDAPEVYEVATPTPIADGSELGDETSEDHAGGFPIVLLAVLGFSVAAVALAHRLSDE